MRTAPLVDRLREQADACRRMGSPLTAALLDGAADDLAAGGPVADLLGPLEADPSGSVPALRFTGALHRLVLERRAPGLAVHYPSVGGTPGDVWPAARAVVEEQRDALAELVRRPVQTNEVGRSSALLGGLLHVAAGSGLPVRLLEVGASGGLNLSVDRFRHEVSDGVVLGDPASPVVLGTPWQGRLPDVGTPLRLVERLGCDPDPLDPSSAQDRLTLTSYVWPDQVDRFERLRGALQVAAAAPERVERLGGADFLERELAPREGVATVVWHSVVWQYLPPSERTRITAAVEGAGARATADAPVAHLWLEPEHVEHGGFVLRLQTWPGGEQRLLADAQGHGPPVVWR
jgi:hypothetical protein